MIKRFKDFESVKAYGSNDIPNGGYVLEIKGARVTNLGYGDVIEVLFDIDQGDYKGFFEKDWNSQTGANKFWKGRTLLNVPTDDGSERDGWAKRSLKTFTTNLEESNQGYVFDWDESKWKGKKIGGLIAHRETRSKNDGAVYMNLFLKQTTTVDNILKGNFKIPTDKLLEDNKGSNSFGFNSPSLDITSSDLPF